MRLALSYSIMKQKGRGLIDFSSFLVIDCICFCVWISNHWNILGQNILSLLFTACVIFCSFVALTFCFDLLCYVVFSVWPLLDSLSIFRFSLVVFFLTIYFYYYFMLYFFFILNTPGSSCTKYLTVLFTFCYRFFFFFF